MGAPRKPKGLERAVGEPEAPFAKLRPGPGQSASNVAADQSARIHGAMIEIVADRGYEAVKVRELVLLAGVSSRAFYEAFSSKEDCFLRTYEMVVRHAAKRIVAAQTGEHDWRERPRLIFAAFAEELQIEPATARFVLSEAHAAGHAAIEQAQRAKHTFETMIGESFARAPNGIAVPPMVIEGMVAGIGRVSRTRLLAGEEEVLRGLTAELIKWALCYPGKSANGLAELDRGSVWRNTMLEPLVSAPATAGGNEWPPAGDRAVIVTAAGKLAAVYGYAHLTVPRIRSAASVSRAVFNTYFEGVEDCFVAALDERAGDALSQASRAQTAGRDASGGTYRAIAALCEQVADDPILASVCLADDFVLNSIGARSRQRVMGAFAEQFVENGPIGERASDLSIEATAGATWAIFNQHMIKGWSQRNQIAATLSFMVLAPTVGSLTALTAIQREQSG